MKLTCYLDHAISDSWSCSWKEDQEVLRERGKDFVAFISSSSKPKNRRKPANVSVLLEKLELFPEGQAHRLGIQIPG